MATQAQTTQHLDAARQLLDDVMEEAAGDPQAKATAAVAHATLVLAEQGAAGPAGGGLARWVVGERAGGGGWVGAAAPPGSGAVPGAPAQGAPAVEAVPRP